MEKFLRATSARRAKGWYHAPPPFWPCNKVLKPNFQSIISQTNSDCSLLSHILAKLLLLDKSYENIFALSIVSALTACPFSINKCAKVSVFYVKTAKIRWRLEAAPPDPRLCPPLLPNPGGATASCAFPPQKISAYATSDICQCVTNVPHDKYITSKTKLTVQNFLSSVDSGIPFALNLGITTKRLKRSILTSICMTNNIIIRGIVRIHASMYSTVSRDIVQSSYLQCLSLILARATFCCSKKTNSCGYIFDESRTKGIQRIVKSMPVFDN